MRLNTDTSLFCGLLNFEAKTHYYRRRCCDYWPTNVWYFGLLNVEAQTHYYFMTKMRPFYDTIWFVGLWNFEAQTQCNRRQNCDYSLTLIWLVGLQNFEAQTQMIMRQLCEYLVISLRSKLPFSLSQTLSHFSSIQLPLLLLLHLSNPNPQFSKFFISQTLILIPNSRSSSSLKP